MDVTPISRNYANVICNAPTNITLSSGNNGVKAAVSAPAGFVNVIGYSASAALGGATATLDTTTSSATTGIISSANGATGTLAVVIAPQSPSQPLMKGNYSDVLSVLLAPQ